MVEPIALLLQISPTSGVPIFRQLIEQFERLILSEQLAAEELLPPVRSLAQQLQINPMTVSRAYGLLEEKGWVERQRGIGMKVRKRISTNQTAPQQEWKQKLKDLLEHGRQLGLDKTQIQNLVKDLMENTDE